MERYNPRFIRFVGGPWHNSHRCVPWLNHFWVLVPIEQAPNGKYVSAPRSAPFAAEICYELTKLECESGTVFFEYHCQGVPGLEFSGHGDWLNPDEVRDGGENENGSGVEGSNFRGHADAE